MLCSAVNVVSVLWKTGRRRRKEEATEGCGTTLSNRTHVVDPLRRLKRLPCLGRYVSPIRRNTLFVNFKFKYCKSGTIRYGQGQEKHLYVTPFHDLRSRMEKEVERTIIICE
jgi:hypothetical protein